MVVNTRSLNNTILGKAYILVFVILICFAGLAHADPVSEIRECNRTNKRDICTKALQHIDELIKSQRATNKQKASAYANRAKILSNAFGQHKKAITDYNLTKEVGTKVPAVVSIARNSFEGVPVAFLLKYDVDFLLLND